LIRRRKRPHPHRAFERELRAGKLTFLHTPPLIAARDFVLYKQNHNPYREGTDDHAKYNAAFEKLRQEFNEKWRENAPHDTTDRNHGEHTL